MWIVANVWAGKGKPSWKQDMIAVSSFITCGFLAGTVTWSICQLDVLFPFSRSVCLEMTLWDMWFANTLSVFWMGILFWLAFRIWVWYQFRRL
ncbi:hypothetical protein V6O07_19030, partial [Arthrospira platensis SPKY2]